MPATIASKLGGSNALDAGTLTMPVDLPAGIVAGDRLLAFVACSSSIALTWPAGWTELEDNATASSGRLVVAYRDADGTEGASITVTGSGGTGARQLVFRITGHDPGTPPARIGAVGTGTSADPVSLDPATWGSESTLWLAAVVHKHGSVATGFPAGYATETNNATGTGTVCLAIGSKTATALSEDPAAFTFGSSAAWRTATYGIRAASATPTPIVPRPIHGPLSRSLTDDLVGVL